MNHFFYLDTYIKCNYIWQLIKIIYEILNEIDFQSNLYSLNTEVLVFDSNKIDNLVVSIKEIGVIQPITVRKVNDNKYEIISGERRYRASKIANLDSIPCYIKAVENDTDLLKMSLVENVQRVDLDPIEIALTY